MKKLLFLIPFLLIEIHLHSQDTILLKTNTFIACKVTEISAKAVKYKLLATADTSIHTELKQNIRLIKFGNGTVEMVENETTSNTKPYDAKNVLAYYNTNIRNDTNKLDLLLGANYLYKKKVITEEQAFDVLNATGIKPIMDYTAKAKQAKQWQWVGYVGIPFGIATLVFEENSISKVYYGNGTTDNRNKVNFESAAGTCLVFAVGCPTFSIVMKSKHKKNRALAVKIFNDRY